MYIAELCNNNSDQMNEDNNVNPEYWNNVKYSETEVHSMPTWLNDVKQTSNSGGEILRNIDLETLNDSQRKA